VNVEVMCFLVKSKQPLAEGGALTERHKERKSVWKGSTNSEFILLVFLRKGGAEMN
jgi:hypothetical protein